MMTQKMMAPLETWVFLEEKKVLEFSLHAATQGIFPSSSLPVPIRSVLSPFALYSHHLHASLSPPFLVTPQRNTAREVRESVSGEERGREGGMEMGVESEGREYRADGHG